MKRIIPTLLALLLIVAAAPAHAASDPVITPEINRFAEELARAWLHNDQPGYEAALDSLLENEAALLLLGERYKGGSYLRGAPSNVGRSRDAVAPWVWLMLLRKSGIDAHPATAFSETEYRFKTR